ncbi:MBL fold metallo-hydrolase [Actinosynnema pretiosum]|uniref:MBL fold metallo-hydrolase n=1 Tax=Actinosynnema pretiosum TaxID=42197 RepID=UPI000A442B8D|nr:MBL fold metallo-hydrolase [Actinosynnema pretiosum]
MEATLELPGLLRLRLDGVAQCYLVRDDDGVTVIDTGTAGHAGPIARWAAEFGPVRRIVLTHHHADHAGSAAALRALTGAPVLAHAADAPVVRGEVEPPPPVLTDEDRPLWEAIAPPPPPAPPCPVDGEVADGDVLPFGGGARVLSIPGHTDGSIALHLPALGVLFTGDALASVGGPLRPGVFNTDRVRLEESVRRLLAVGADLVCVGHGKPVRTGAPR